MICCRIPGILFMISSALGLAAFSSELSANTTVEVRETADYLALGFEAEDHETADERWVLTDPTTPAVDPSMDPDPNHSDLAVGNTYIELLPDYRVHEDDPFIGPNGEQGLWNTPGTGPIATYIIDFPEAGRYYVHARALSTGKEDNGIHFGLDGDWPDSSKRHQFCTSGQGWKWSSRQRDSGGEDNPCGVDHTSWITVDTPGTHTFALSAREDGFELDRIILIKDLSNNTRICSVSGENSISCRDGSLENVDEVADVTVAIDTSVSEMDYTDNVTLSVHVENLDAYDDANNVSLQMDIAYGTRWDLSSSLPEACNIANASIACDIGLLETSPPDDNVQFEFILVPLMSGALSIDASVSTSTVDGDQDNDSASIEITVTDVGRLSRLDAQLSGSLSNWTVGQTYAVTARVENLGAGQALDAQLEFTLADGLLVNQFPEGCIGFSTIVCTLGEMDVDAVESVILPITASEAGLFSVSLGATASNLDGEEPIASYIATVVSSQPEEEEEPPEPTEENAQPEDRDDAEGDAQNSSGLGAAYAGLMLLLLSAGYRARQSRAQYRNV